MSDLRGTIAVWVAQSGIPATLIWCAWLAYKIERGVAG